MGLRGREEETGEADSLTELMSLEEEYERKVSVERGA